MRRTCQQRVTLDMVLGARGEGGLSALRPPLGEVGFQARSSISVRANGRGPADTRSYSVR